MPIPVVGSVSEAEAIGLGKLLEHVARKQTGTLFNGIDIAPDDYDTIAGYVKSMFVHRIGKCTMGLLSCMSLLLQHCLTQHGHAMTRQR